MKKILMAALLSAVIIFLWGFISWTVAHFHDATYKLLPAGDEIAKIFTEKISNDGVYYYPGDIGDAQNKDDLDSIAVKHKEGPLFKVIYIKKGIEMMSPVLFVKSFIIYFIASFIIAFILNMVKESLPTFLRRLSFILSFALFAGLVTYISNHVWLYYPIGYSLVMALDILVGWTLAGILIAAIIKPVRKYSFT